MFRGATSIMERGKRMRKLFTAALAGLSLGASVSLAFAADDKKVVIAYQTGSTPYFVGIANGDIARKTGWDIEFRRFNSGADISGCKS